MSQENVEVVRGAYDRFIRELTAPIGEEDLVDFLDPEVVLDVTRRVLNPAIYHGYAGILQGRRVPGVVSVDHRARTPDRRR